MVISCPKLFDVEIQVNRKIRRSMQRYLGGILLFSGRKNCSAISRSFGLSHDALYEFFHDIDTDKMLLYECLKKSYSKLPTNTEEWHINIDETLIEKMYSEKMEAVAKNWSGSHDTIMNGHAIIAAVITNNAITIPINFKTWYSQKTFPDRHKTRIQIAQELMIEIKKEYPDLMFLLDGAFSSEDMLRFCTSNKIKFCMRFNSNKKIVIGTKDAQVRKHELIKTSSKRRARSVRGMYKGVSVYFVAFKRYDKNGNAKFVYLVTSEKEPPKKTIKTYKKRWNIEKFFRTAKQHLGLRDCQALGAAKQEVHILTVFVAYAWLQIQKFNRKAKNPEQILHKIRKQKTGDLVVQLETFLEIA